MGKGKTLHFKTYEEAGKWFDTQDMSDYDDKLRPVDFHFDLRKNREWVELEREIAKIVRKLAKKQNIPTRKLVNELLRDRLEHLQ
ncbi:MAG: hypothetical protein JRJ47_08760 [Deltaproteobacteria bacterium]|nr:hypothetical protein [Deltaproteobacteria bacterium]MBW1896598.1 hypothetical protein [Deltaproteobacteria bacterium]